MRYEVRLVRAVLETVVVQVTAPTEEDAKRLAVEHGGIANWRRFSEREPSDATVDTIEEVG